MARACAAIVIFGMAFVHTDDVDGMFYRQMAQRIWRTGQWLDIGWDPMPAYRFIEHLPVILWPSALLEGMLGEWGMRLGYAAMSFATLLLMLAWARRQKLGDIDGVVVLVALTTESFIRVTAEPRIDPPFLLAWVGAIVLAHRHVVLSALCVGVAILFRAPPSLALFVLVPAAVWVERDLSWRDLQRYLLFIAVALVLPLAFLWVDLRWGPGDNWSRYLDRQVWASLTGERPDGDGSHFGPLRFLFERFWPGLPLVVFALATVRKNRAIVFLTLWAVAVVAGFSLGRRHVYSHTWPAYLPLFLLAGLGGRVLLDRFPLRLPRLWPAVSLLGLIGYGIGQYVICDVARYRRKNEAPSGTIYHLQVNGSPIFHVVHRFATHFDNPSVLTDDPTIGDTLVADPRAEIAAPVVFQSKKFNVYQRPSRLMPIAPTASEKPPATPSAHRFGWE